MPLAEWALACALAASPARADGCAPPARAIVAEVCYDAPGDDTGHEFVELYDPGDSPVPLAGLRLEAGDGAGPGRWTLRWTGASGDTVRPGARFVIGGALVSPAPDAVATLDLQNGPDAMRLVWPDGASEVVGWGALAYGEYFCGAPAADVASGQSLARVPDDADAGSNAADFRPATPSPGRPNVRARDAALAPGRLTLDPPLPPAGGAARLSATIENHGSDPLAAGAAALEVTGTPLPAAASLPLPALAGGDSARVEVALPALREGRAALYARVALAGDEDPANDGDSLVVRVGEGPLAVTEIQFHPAAGEGEWLEVRNRGGTPWPLGGLLAGDRAGARGRARTALVLAPESLAVLAQSRDALIALHPALDTARVVEVSPWAALNNADDSLGIADIVQLADSDGVPLARVPYSAAGVPAGVTLEWADGAWRPSDLAGGTPLSPPPPRMPVPGRFSVTPRRLRAGRTTVRFAWDLPWPRADVTLELYDLEGRRARRLDAFAAGARGERSETLDVASPGLYLAVLRARAGDASLTRVAALRVEQGAP